MTRKHFIALAAEIAKISDFSARLAAAHAAANAALSFNPAFSCARFFFACRVS